MAEVIRMPRMSDTMTEGVIVSWHKKVGDKIKSGDLLAEVETDKATMELESYNEGTLLYLGVEQGKSVQVDGILAVVGKEGEDYKTALNSWTTDNRPQTTEEGKKMKDDRGQRTENTQQAIDNMQLANNKQQTTNNKPETTNQKHELPAGAKEIRMPLLSDTMTEGKIIAWHKKLGDFVKSDDVLAEVETDKATMDVVGYEEGTLLYIGVEAGKAAKINQIIAIVGKEGTDVSAYVQSEASDKRSVISDQKQQTINNKPETLNLKLETLNPKQETDQRIKASPLAKKLAEDKGIDLTQVNGSGDNGRITKKDIDSFKEKADNRGQMTADSNNKQQTINNKPETSNLKLQTLNFKPQTEESYTDIPLTQMRKVIARRLGESKFSAPHFYLTTEVNMDNAITARTAMNDVSPVKISFNDMLIKACATALRLHPDVNSSWMNDFIRQNHHIHIGSAVAMPEGLIVPVIKFADQKSLSQIAGEAKELYGKAKDKKLQPQEFSGNTFTISNLGMMDIEEFTAIINPPDSCILAVGKIKEIVVKKEDGFGVTNVMKLTLSCDHRSVDGAVGAAFLQTLKKFVENPAMMLV